MPKIFAVSSISFDHDPADSELTCLLQGPRQPIGFRIIETDGTIRATSALVPVKGIILSMLVGATVMTLGARLMVTSGNATLTLWEEIVFGIWTAAIWFVILPVTLVAMIFSNRKLAKIEDFFRVDLSERVLKIGHAGRTFRASEIRAFTDLSRWFHNDSAAWSPRRQIGVLVRTPASGTELFLLLDGDSNRPLADRLASIFQVPVRRIELNKAESKALNDC
jgi:hypothetical protein